MSGRWEKEKRSSGGMEKLGLDLPLEPLGSRERLPVPTSVDGTAPAVTARCRAFDHV
jgi:hypothetical protein